MHYVSTYGRTASLDVNGILMKSTNVDLQIDGYMIADGLQTIVAWLTGLMTSTVSLCFLPLAPPPVAAAILALYLLCALQAFYLFRMAGNFSAVNAALFPVALLFYQRLFFRSLLRRRQGKTVQWKGRDVL